MFVSFLEPFPIRHTKAPFLWVFYKQLNHFNKEDIIFIGSKEYFKDPLSWGERLDISITSQKKNKYTIPSFNRLKEYPKFIVEENIFVPLKEKFRNSLDIYQFLLKNEYKPLKEKIEEIISEIGVNNIDAFLLWANNPTIEGIARKYNIPVIHNELGPLRAPIYFNTAYFDFRGINGNSESESRFLKFKNEIFKNDYLSIEDLRYIFFNSYDMPIFNPIFKSGIALQVEDDSNIIAYSNGYDFFKLLNEVLSLYNKDEILIRHHPLSKFKVSNYYGVIDTSKNSVEFLTKINKLFTINSSLGLEAIFWGLEVEAKGDSSYKFILKDINYRSNLIEYLNFYLISYLIPYELLFDKEYYKWRLSFPNEKEIFDKHKEILLTLKGISKSYYNIPNQILIKSIKNLENELNKKTESIKNLENELNKKTESIKNLENELNKKNNEIIMYVTSRSWKYTRILRKLKKFITK